MRKILQVVLAAGLAAAASGAQAQIKCWNEGGKRVCGDAPPAGARTTTINTPSAPAQAPSAASKDAGKDGKGTPARKGPLTPAEQEQEFRKRQQEAKKAADKAEAEQKDAAIKRENCARAKEYLSTLQSGQRIARTDAKGERYYMDDAQVAQETAKARQAVQENCS